MNGLLLNTDCVRQSTMVDLTAINTIMRRNFRLYTTWTWYKLYVMRGMNSPPVDLILLAPHS